MKYSHGPTAAGGQGHPCHHLVPLAACVRGCPRSNAQGSEHHCCIRCPLDAALLPGMPVSIWTRMLGLAVTGSGPGAVLGATMGREVAPGAWVLLRHRGQRGRHGDILCACPGGCSFTKPGHSWPVGSMDLSHLTPSHPRVQNWDKICHVPAQGAPGRAVAISLQPPCAQPRPGSREVSWRMDRACRVALSFTG